MYPPTLVASGQLTGALGTVTATLTVACAAGDFPVGIFSAGSNAPFFASCADSAGNGWSIVSVGSLGVAWPTAGALTTGLGIGATITATLNTGTPGGRMFSVGNYGQPFVTATPIDQQNTQGPILNTATITATTPGPATATDLCVAACRLSSALAGGTDAITTVAPLAQRDNRNHTAITTAYCAWGDVQAPNPVSGTFTSLSASNTMIAVLVTFKLIPVGPSTPGSATYAWRPIMESVLQREGYSGLE